MNTITKTETAAYAEMQSMADERQRWANVLSSTHRPRVRHDVTETVHMIGWIMLVAILSIGAAVVAVLA